MAQRIQEIREAKKLSRSALAKKAKTTRIRIWRLENGTTDVSAEDAAIIAEALGVSVAALYKPRAA